ncbi:hypothetical protein H634G_02869, partial [Metarhizium anisopliae BRIP 53293]
MFSEYASRFLAQSQSRLSGFAGQGDNDNNPRSNEWPPSRPGRSQRDAGRVGTTHRSFLSRGYGGNPYQQNGSGSRFGNIGFASRISAAQDAPLFHSTLDEFREDDDEEEREREAADLFALQRSRRVAAASKLAESTESANSRGSIEDSTGDVDHPYQDRIFSRGIRSSWNGTRSSHKPPFAGDTLFEENEELSKSGEEQHQDAGSHPQAKSKIMVDVGLDSQEEGDEDPPESLLGGEAPTDSSPPPFQRFKSQSEREPFILRRTSTTESDISSVQRNDPLEYEVAQPGNLLTEG